MESGGILAKGSVGRWTKAESDMLLQACHELDSASRKWTDVSAWLCERGIYRGATQCRHRAQALQGSGVQGERKKGAWDPEEDRLLVIAVNTARHEASDSTAALEWQSIANAVPGRNSKACRERWTSRLNPNIDRTPMRPDEEELLVRLKAGGNCSWSSIAKQLPGRTADWVKCKFVSLQRREKQLRRAGGCAAQKRKQQPETRHSDCAPEMLAKCQKDIESIFAGIETKERFNPPSFKRGLSRQSGSRAMLSTVGTSLAKCAVTGTDVAGSGKGRGLRKNSSNDSEFGDMLARLSSMSERLSVMSMAGDNEGDDTDTSTPTTDETSKTEIDHVLNMLDSVDSHTIDSPNVQPLAPSMSQMPRKPVLSHSRSSNQFLDQAEEDAGIWESNRNSKRSLSLCSLLGEISTPKGVVSHPHETHWGRPSIEKNHSGLSSSRSLMRDDSLNELNQLLNSPRRSIYVP